MKKFAKDDFEDKIGECSASIRCVLCLALALPFSPDLLSFCDANTHDIVGV